MDEVTIIFEKWLDEHVGDMELLKKARQLHTEAKQTDPNNGITLQETLKTVIAGYIDEWYGEVRQSLEAYADVSAEGKIMYE